MTLQRWDKSCAEGVPRVLKQWAVPVGIAPSGSVGSNGALTLGTALPVTYDSGIWLYFPAGAIAVGSAAGLYWCRMGSTTAGTVYNTVLNGSQEVPYIPPTDVPFVTTGPGAYTGVTSTVTVATAIVPGGAIGPNGTLLVQDVKAATNSAAGNKVVGVSLGGSSIGDKSIVNTSTNLHRSVQNRGRQDRQIAERSNQSSPGYEASADFSRQAVDTSANQPFRITLLVETATNFLILETARVSVVSG